ncbi:hypothetical protein B566_EDAN016609, partial [Ephemera danica]
MREIGRFCRAYCSENHSMWCNLLPKIMLWHNCTYHASIGCTPYELHYGRKPVREISKMINFPQLEGPKPDPSNLTARLSSALDKEIKKFFHLYEGPYHVFCIIGPNAYLIGNLQTQVVK